MSIFGWLSKGGADGVISHDDLVKALDADSVALVDVREVNEYESGHAPGAINLPLSHFDPAALPTGKPVVLICQAGGRSGRALAAAKAAGVTDIVHYAGGMSGWRSHGGDVV